MNIFTRDKPRIMNKTILSVLLAAVLFPAMLGAQNYFVDGFHGGVYGHYPLETYTGYMCDLLDDNPDFKIGLEIEPETWDSVRVVAPLDYGRLRERLAEGDRVEYNNPTYAQPYFFNIGGESVIRQLEYGIRKLEGHFPGIRINTYACEEPCFTSCLPTVLAGFGFKYAAIKNPNTCWGGYSSPARGGIVRWTGPDGTFLRAVPRYSTEALGNDVWTTTANGLHPEYYSSAASDGVRHPVAMCFQDAGWTNGPWLSEERKEEDSVENVTWTEYFTRVAGRDKAVPYRMNQDDVRVALVWGSQVLQRIARSVRKAENSIVAAEKTGVIAHLANNYDYDHSAMDEAWRTLLLSQHHDSWIVPYNGLKGRGTWADWIVDRWTAGTVRTAEKILSEAALSFGAAGSGILRVFNTLPYAREEVVETVLSGCPSGKEPFLEGLGGETVESEFDAASGKLSFMAKVPAFGFAAFKIGFREKGKAPEPGEDNPYKIGNEFYEITFDPDRGGVITSIILKKEGSRELVRESDPCFGEMKGYFYEENAFHSSAEAPASLEKGGGNLVSTMHVKGTVGGHPFCQTVMLRKGDPKILFDLEIDWQGHPGIGTFMQRNAYANPRRSFYDEKGHLNIYFPTSADGGTLYKNAPFDVCRSVNDSTRFDDWHDIKHNVILNWVYLRQEDGRGIALLSDHTTSYVNTPGTPLGLTLQYAGNGLWGRDYRIDGPTRLAFAVVPHEGGWDAIEKEDRRWNEPLIPALAGGEGPSAGSFLSVNDPGCELTSATLMGNGIRIRLYNACGGKRIKVLLDGRFTEAYETDMRGNVLHKVRLRSRHGQKQLRARMGRHAIKTFLLK